MFDKLIRRVCFEFGVSRDDIFKKKLSNSASQARKIIIYFMYSTRSTTEVMRELKLKTETTIYNSVTSVRDKIAIDPEYKSKLQSIKIDLR